MPIIVNLDVMLARRKIRSKELAEAIGITEQNLSILKTGKYFLHGFITALIFGILMTLVRMKFMQQYINANPDAIDKGEDMLHRFHYIRSPMVIISIFVVITSIVSGMVAWISGFIATKILAKKA